MKSNDTKSRILIDQKDFIHFFALYIFTVGAVYFLPSTLTSLYFYVLLALFFRSSKNYFWFAFVLVVENSPGRLFSVNSDSYSLAILSIAGLRELYLQELFVFVAIIKFFVIGKYEKLFINNNLKIIGLYTIFLLVLGHYLGVDIFSSLRSFRMLLPFSLLIIIPIFFKRTDDYTRFYSLIFPMIIFVFLVQLFEIMILNKPIANLLGESNILIYGEFARLFYSPWLLLAGFIGAMFFLSTDKSSFSIAYLEMILIIIILSFTLSATRGYVISTVFMYLLFLIFIKNINVKYLALISILLIFILSSIVISPSVSRTFEYAINRISTLESIVQGDLTAEGTLSRITDRSPRVLDKFSERPLTGFGFSNEYSDYADVHVGNETLLLKGGIIGYFFMLLLMFNFNIKLFKRNVILTNANPYKKSLYIFIIGFIGFFIIHSSSGYIFNYGIDFNRGMAITVSMLFTFADRVYKESKYHQKYKSCN
jgi:hypothetical protein